MKKLSAASFLTLELLWPWQPRNEKQMNQGVRTRKKVELFIFYYGGCIFHCILCIFRTTCALSSRPTQTEMWPSFHGVFLANRQKIKYSHCKINKAIKQNIGGRRWKVQVNCSTRQVVLRPVLAGGGRPILSLMHQCRYSFEYALMTKNLSLYT